MIRAVSFRQLAVSEHPLVKAKIYMIKEAYRY